MAPRTLFVRELATFIHADIPLLEALGVLRRQEKNPAFKAILDDVHDRVQGGESFSRALSAHPKVFSPLLINMVRVGETGGLLGPVLEQMATWMEHEEEVKGEIRGAMAYPIMIMLLGMVTVMILFSFVLPRITAVFSGGMELPLLTRVLMGVADFMGRAWWIVLLAAVALAVLVRYALKTEAGRAFYDRLSLGFPLFGTLVQKSAIARFARANAALLASGVPLLESLRVVQGILGNSLMSAMVAQAIERVTRGHSLARSLEESPWFPPSVVHLLGVGERTGRLAEMFNRVAQTFERQTRGQIKVMLNLLSPLMIIGLAAMVAVIAIAILLPIFRLNSMMR
jgi:type II secretory pathway component PulF